MHWTVRLAIGVTLLLPACATATSFGPAQVITEGDGVSLSTDLAVSANGSAVLVVTRTELTSEPQRDQDVEIYVRPPRRAFGAPARIIPDANGFDVGIDDRGHAVVAVHAAHERLTLLSFTADRRRPWIREQSLGELPDWPYGQPRLEVSPHGGAIVAFSPAWEIRVARRNGLGPFRAPQLLCSRCVPSDVAIGGNGLGWVTYTETAASGTGSRVLAARVPRDTAPAAVPISPDFASAAPNPQIAADRHGNAIVSYNSAASPRTGALHLVRVSRTGAVAPEQILSFAGDIPFPVDLGMSAAGRAAVVWGRAPEEEPVVDAAYAAPGRPFGDPQMLGRGQDPRLAVSRDGDLAVSWTPFSEPFPVLLISRYGAARTYHPTLSGAGAHMALSSPRNATVVWNQGSLTGRSLVLASRTGGPDYAVPAPVSLRAHRQTRRQVLQRKAIRVSCRVRTQARCHVTIRRGQRVVARGAAPISGAQIVLVSVRLTSAGRRIVRSAGKPITLRAYGTAGRDRADPLTIRLR